LKHYFTIQPLAAQILHKDQKENNLKVRRKEERKTEAPSAFKDKNIANYINNNSKIISLLLIKFYDNKENEEVK
jgi:hypothetical protein